MPTLNLFLWITGLALQLLLLLLVVRTGLVRRLPSFTLMLAFYLVRSLALFALGRTRAAAGLPMIDAGLAVIDLCLQVAVAWELFRVAALDQRALNAASALRRLAFFCVPVVLAAIVAWSVATLTPASPRFPVDRGIVFSATLLLAIATIVVRTPLAISFGNEIRRVTAGFVFLSVATLLAQVMRALAGFHRDRGAFQAWSYVQPAAYLVVLSFWSVSLARALRSRQPSQRGQSQLSAQEASL